MSKKFLLGNTFLDGYKLIKPPFGFNGLGELVYYRTYSRLKDNGENEVWWETIKRVVEGTYNFQKRWIESNELEWNTRKAQESAQLMYDKIFNMKFLPPGRGLWAMGSSIVEDRNLAAALFNCAFYSTENIAQDLAKPFLFMMDMSMLGVGVGFDVKGAGKIRIGEPSSSIEYFQIEDTRESWVESLEKLLISYFNSLMRVEFDYSKIRDEGLPIKGFGGVSSGPEPLRIMHEQIRETLNKNINQPISETTIADIMNLIGVCVVAGNVRRTAQVIFGNSASQEYLDLKNYKVNPHRETFGWSSNNSIFCDVGMNYQEAAERTRINGEPGYFWLENAKNYSRMCDKPDYKDIDVKGANPCFAPETLIALADGRDYLSIEQLAKEGKDVPVYSVNKEGIVEIKWARNPRLTQKNQRMVKINLDDDSSITVTLDHKMRLRHGNFSLAKDLKVGDSLCRFDKKIDCMTKGKKLYKFTHTDTNIGNPSRKAEHRLIAKFFNTKQYEEKYDEYKKNGWLKGGLVIHHKDHDGLNNRPENLEIMSFRDHNTLHGKGLVGPENPMWGRHHSSKTKKLIGQNNVQARRNKSPNGILAADIIRQKRKERIQSFNERAIKSGLKIKRVKKAFFKIMNGKMVKAYQKRIIVLSECVICKQELKLRWDKRHIKLCSKNKCHQRFCKEYYHETMKGKIVEAFRNRQQNTLEKQSNVYLDLKNAFNRNPLKKEWENKCRELKIPVRFQNPKHPENPYVMTGYRELQQYSESKNHKVKSIEFLTDKSDVYNLTVDDNYTVGVITKIEERQMSGIFVFQCVEQSLQSGECCCLVETFPNNHSNYEEYQETLKCAYLYGKTVTLAKTHWKETNRIMLRNRRIGTSMSGIAQFIQNKGIHELKDWCERGYKHIQKLDEVYSSWLCVPRSIKMTSVKPSGSVSLLAGATPGLHYPESRYYIRRMRLSIHSDLVQPLRDAGYNIEPCFGSEDSTLVVEIPVDIGEIRTLDEVSIWEQFELAAFMQQYWADNQVSCTVTFDPNTDGKDIEKCLNYYQYRLKAISLLPRAKIGAFRQMPYEKIDQQTFDKINKGITQLNFSNTTGEKAEIERFCDGDSCIIKT